MMTLLESSPIASMTIDVNVEMKQQFPSTKLTMKEKKNLSTTAWEGGG